MWVRIFFHYHFKHFRKPNTQIVIQFCFHFFWISFISVFLTDMRWIFCFIRFHPLVCVCVCVYLLHFVTVFHHVCEFVWMLLWNLLCVVCSFIYYCVVMLFAFCSSLFSVLLTTTTTTSTTITNVSNSLGFHFCFLLLYFPPFVCYLFRAISNC